MVADNANLIPQIVAEAKAKDDLPTRRDLEKKVQEINRLKKKTKLKNKDNLAKILSEWKTA